jgi:hypothetical protein
VWILADFSNFSNFCSYLFSFFISSSSFLLILLSKRLMCCLLSSKLSSNRWICTLCDSWRALNAVRKRAISSISRDICKTRKYNFVIIIVSTKFTSSTLFLYFKMKIQQEEIWKSLNYPQTWEKTQINKCYKFFVWRRRLK